VFTWLQLMFDDALWGDTAHNLHGDLRYDLVCWIHF
jgi:hypothetical protein